MPVGIVTKAKNFLIFLIRPAGVVQSMGGIEMGFSKNGDFHVE